MAAVTPIIYAGLPSVVDGQQEIRKVKSLMVYTAATVDAADTFEVDLTDFGGTTLLGTYGNSHTTTDSVITVEDATTTVASSVITFTVPAGTDNDQRVVKIFFV